MDTQLRGCLAGPTIIMTTPAFAPQQELLGKAKGVGGPAVTRIEPGTWHMAQGC